jgi:hypothetical protein
MTELAELCIQKIQLEGKIKVANELSYEMRSKYASIGQEDRDIADKYSSGQIQYDQESKLRLECKDRLEQCQIVMESFDAVLKRLDAEKNELSELIAKKVAEVMLRKKHESSPNPTLTFRYCPKLHCFALGCDNHHH